MAGEMSRSEVTAESFPKLFELRDALAAEGIESDPRPFDQYQGPYLYVKGVGRCWYSDDESGETFLIERGRPPINTFETKGADRVFKATDKSLRHGVYFIDSAVERIKAIKS